MNYLRYVRLVGTMHVSPRSREEVYRTILEERPDAVAIELDRARFLGMQAEVETTLGDSLRYGRRGAVNYLLAKVEAKLGEEFGMKPGEEMKAAIAAAQHLDIPLYLIDEDINVIMTKIVAAPRREKLLMGLEAAAVFLPFPGGTGEDPLEDYRVMMIQFRERYPYLYRVLVDERNQVMAHNLISIVDSLRAGGVARPRVVAVVGMGHKPGLEHYLNTPEKLPGQFLWGF